MYLKEGGLMHGAKLVLTEHAYQRYCQRVEPIERKELESWLREQSQRPNRRKREYIQLGGIWWRFGRKGKELILYSCYGKTHIDLPAAIRWAKQFGDRIALGERDGF